MLQQHATPDKHMVETMAGGLAVFDYDGDGRPDIFFTNGAALPSLASSRRPIGIACTTTTANFTSPMSPSAPACRASGTRPARPSATSTTTDMQTSSSPACSTTSCYATRGDGTFEDVTASAGIKNYTWSVAAGWFDYDNDGWLDLFVVNYVDWTPEGNKYCGDRVARHPRLLPPQALPRSANALYRNRHDGTFEDVSEKSGIAARSRQGHERRVRGLRRRRVHRHLRHQRRRARLPVPQPGNGTFEEVALLAGVGRAGHGRPVSSMGTDFRDYDNDGWPDIALTALTGETFPLFRNDGREVFSGCDVRERARRAAPSA